MISAYTYITDAYVYTYTPNTTHNTYINTYLHTYICFYNQISAYGLIFFIELLELQKKDALQFIFPVTI